MLSESQLVSFLDEKSNYVIHFFDGQKLIADMSTIHGQSGSGFIYFRDCILAAQPIISFLKPRESFGLYIDNEQPYFRFKLETGHNGLARFLLIPTNVENLPVVLQGVGRLTKGLPGAAPYTSIIKIDGFSFLQVVNRILSDSYQVDSKVILSHTSDQSILITRLPLAVGRNSEPTLALDSYEEKMLPYFSQIFSGNFHGTDAIKEAMAKGAPGLTYLQSREVKFHCPCNKESFIRNLVGLQNNHPDDLFHPEENHLDIECDYCHKKYVVTRSEITPLQ